MAFLRDSKPPEGAQQQLRKADLERGFFTESHTWDPNSPSDPPPASGYDDDVDEEEEEDQSQPGASSRGWRFYACFACLCLISFITALDATIISVAVPTIAKDIGASAVEASWMGTSFLLASTVFQPTFASFSHILGRKPVLLFALALFTVGSVLCAVARNVALMLAGRVLQGSGAGGLLALTYVIATDLVSLRERGKWFSLIAMTWAVGSVVGPVVGGALAESWWPWIFWINLPFCALAFVAIPVVLTLQRREGSIGKKLWAFDWFGAVLFVASLTAVLIPLSWGGISYEWNDARTVAPLIAGLAGLAAFGVHITKLAPRYGADPLLRPSLFTTVTGLTGYFNTALQGIIVWCIMFYLPLYSEVPLGQTPTMAGISLFPYSATVAPAAAVVGMFITKSGSYRPTIWIGWAMATLGLGLLILLEKDTATVEWVFIYLVGGLGLGALYSALSFACQASASNDDLPFAAGMYAFCRSLGQCLGVAIGGVVFQNSFRSAIRENPQFSAHADQWARDASALAGEVHGMPPEAAATKEAIVDGFIDALRSVWILMTILSGVGLVTGVLFIKHKSLDRNFEASQGLVDGRRGKNGKNGPAGPAVRTKYPVKEKSGYPSSSSSSSSTSSLSSPSPTTKDAPGGRMDGRDAVQPRYYFYPRIVSDPDPPIVVSDAPPVLGPLDFEFDFRRSIMSRRPPTANNAAAGAPARPARPDDARIHTARWSVRKKIPVVITHTRPGAGDSEGLHFPSREVMRRPSQRPNDHQSALRGAVPGPPTEFHRPLTRGGTVHNGSGKPIGTWPAPTGMGVWRPSEGSTATGSPSSTPGSEKRTGVGRLWRGGASPQQQGPGPAGSSPGRYTDAYGRRWEAPVRVPVRTRSG